MQRLIFSNARIKEAGKVTLECDADGYYTMPAMTFGEPSRSFTKDTYMMDESVESYLNDPKSRFNICIRDGQLYGELDHPRQEPGQSEMAFYARNRQIWASNTAIFIRSVWLDKVTRPDGRTITTLFVKFKPYGPNKEMVIDAINDPNINFALSGRFFSKFVDTPQGRRRYLIEVVTFDVVLRQGLPGACKYGQYTVESEDTYYDMNKLVREMAEESATGSELSQESSCILSHEDLCKSYGLKEHSFRITSKPRSLDY